MPFTPTPEPLHLRIPSAPAGPADLRGAPRESLVAGPRPTAFAHHFTVDVEEYFHVSALEPFVRRESWGERESRVERGMAVLLEALAAHRAGGTFFVLGWLAERQPQVVRAIVDAGHEVASHGWDHLRVTHQTPEQFRSSVRRSKALLEDQSGGPVLGFRAPSFSIVPGREWALDVLAEEGYRYDSSLFPVRRRAYGYPTAQVRPHRLRRRGGTLEEFPPATLRVGRGNLPVGGGAYFRLFPYAVIRSAFRRLQTAGVPGTFYIHPWELDPGQPRLAVPWTTRIRHYGGLAATQRRIHRLLREFRFTSIASTLGAS